MTSILIVEDDNDINNLICNTLKAEGYQCERAFDGKEGADKIEQNRYDLLLLDIMLPDESGYDIIKKLRLNSATKRLPVIMVTAKSTELDMIKGLEDGADDYIKKPFSVMELITRVKALLRRTETDEAGVLDVGEIELNHERHAVTVSGKQVELTFKEYELLRYLMANKNIVLSRDSIVLKVWGTEFEGESRTVDMHIKTLRQKLGDAGSRIRTVRNVGYVIE